VFERDRPAGSFVGAHGSVGVQPDDQHVAEAARLLQVAHVAGVEEVEDAVGEHDPLAGGAGADNQGNGLVECHNQSLRIHGCRSTASAQAWIPAVRR
jgi:hypothetical protein